MKIQYDAAYQKNASLYKTKSFHLFQNTSDIINILEKSGIILNRNQLQPDPHLEEC
jgi:hypothetical protein